jgi:HSP20 family molecular chaperone IbpA
MNIFDPFWFTSTPSFDLVRDVKTEEKDDEYVIMFDAAGIKKEAIKITVEDNFLIVKGNGDWKNINYKVKLAEISKDITAKLEDGILTVTIKKKKEKEPLCIEVL